MENIYSNVDALIHPTLGDTFGMSVLEAMSFSLPVIVSSPQYCGLSYELSEKEVIFIENPRDAKEIKEKIDMLVSNDKLRKKLSIEARKKALEFSWKNTMLQTIDSYNELLGG